MQKLKQTIRDGSDGPCSSQKFDHDTAVFQDDLELLLNALDQIRDRSVLDQLQG